MLKKKLVAFRFEANSVIGLGHAVRICSLAGKFDSAIIVISERSKNSLVAFAKMFPDVHIIPEGQVSGSWIDFESMANVSTVVLDISFAGNASQAEEEVRYLKNRGRSVVVVDSMPPDHFVPLFQKIMETMPDLLITPYSNAEMFRPRIARLNWVYGSRYAILPDEFRDARSNLLGTKLPRRILVTCGGSDPSALSVRILKALRGSDIPIDIIVGPLFDVKVNGMLESLVGTMPNVTLCKPGVGLLPLLAKNGLIVGRPGLTRYEAACLGLRALYFVEGPSYAEYFHAFAQSGFAEFYYSNTPQSDAKFISRLLEIVNLSDSSDFWTRNTDAMSQVDGDGAERISGLIRRLCLSEMI